MKNLNYLLLLAAITLFASCGSDHGEDGRKETPEDIVEPDVAETTILIYMPYTGPANDLTDELQTNLTQIRQAIRANKGMGNDKVIAFISKNEKTSHLIQYHYSRLSNTTVSDTLMTYDNTLLDFSSSSIITEVATRAKTAAPAKEYAMIIGCHAMGWVRKSGLNGIATRLFGGNASKYQMENAELPKGLSDAGIGKLKFLLFDDCYMANIESAYEMRSCTHKFIGSTCEVMGAGLPYQDMFKYLLGTPDYEKAIEAFYKFYSTSSYPYGTLSLIDCDKIDAMAAVMKKVNATTPTLTTSEVGKLQGYDNFRNTVFFDLGDYLSRRCASDAALLAEAQAALKQLVPIKVNTPNYLTWDSSTGTNTIHPITTYSGISCSDPSLNAAIAADKLLTDWWIATH